MKRRNFITLVGTSIAAAPVWANVYNIQNPIQKAIESTFPELPYAYNALEPTIDAKTMEIHYSKHHKAYHTNFLAALKDSPAAELDLKSLFAEISKYSPAIRNNGGGYYNHSLFWENMSPAKTNPSVVLKGVIEKSFGSVDKFKEEFANAAKKQFGSGWAWLIAGKDGQVFVSSTPNQDNPLMDVVEKKGTPLLCLDVWEHAYYLQYQNRRAEYVDNFWNVVNWDTVNKRYENR
ncbi:MAG: superoxide dismutase [Bacteroidota bacterium]|nr:superoxide dismutase [Odoribacter sp.]MDP3644198.1 superoxide dismutase [Bacteroidota bacterium]